MDSDPSGQLPPSASTTGDKRLYVLDLARFIAMIMMMQGHTLDSLVSPTQLDINQFPWNIWNFIRGLTAPVFLMVSGAVHVFAMKRDEQGRMSSSTMRRRINWAFFLLAVGYFLVFPANRLFDLPYLNAQSWQYFFQVNILQLTAFALLALVAVSRLTRSVKSLGLTSAIIAGVVFGASPFINTFDWFSVAPEAIASLFSYKHGSLFPIFPFAGFLFAGTALGAGLKLLPSNVSITEFALRWGYRAGGILLVVAALLAIILQSLPVPAHDFQMSNPAFMLVRISLILGFFSLCSWLIQRLDRYKSAFSMFSAKALHIYVIHLILLYGTPWFSSIARIYPKALGLDLGVVLAVAVVALTLMIVYAEEYIRSNVEKANLILKYSLGTIVVYLLLI